MATVFKRKKRGGGEYEDYCVRVMVNGQRKQVSLKTTNRKEAERRAARIEAAMVEGRLLGQPKRTMTVNELFARWMEYAKGNKKSYERDEIAIRLMASIIGKVQITDVTGDDLKRYADSRQVKGSTIRRDLSVLTAAMNKAVKWGFIDRSPVEHYDLPPAGAPRERVLTSDELDGIGEKMVPVIRRMMMVAVDTALRLSNVRLLRWKQVNLATGLITIPASETKQGRPHVAVMTDQVKAILKEQIGGVASISGYVFLSSTGQPYRRDSVTHAFTRAAKRAGVEGVCFHDLRHTCLTRAAAAGATGPDLMFMAGHSDLRMTARYTHQDLDRRRKVAAMLEAANWLQSGYTAPDGGERIEVNR